jgi:uncharacterized membrane protein
MKKREDLNKNAGVKEDNMKHIVRAGLGFIGGLFTLWGAFAIQSNNFLVGIISIIIGIVIFFYGYKG